MDNVNMLVTYTIKGNKRQEFLAALNDCEVIRKTRKEMGNKDYKFFIPVDDYAQVVLLESWASKESLEKHLDTEHYKALKKLKDKYVINTILENFEKV